MSVRFLFYTTWLYYNRSRINTDTNISLVHRYKHMINFIEIIGLKFITMISFREHCDIPWKKHLSYVSMWPNMVIGHPNNISFLGYYLMQCSHYHSHSRAYIIFECEICVVLKTNLCRRTSTACVLSFRTIIRGIVLSRIHKPWAFVRSELNTFPDFSWSCCEWDTQRRISVRICTRDRTKTPAPEHVCSRYKRTRAKAHTSVQLDTGAYAGYWAGKLMVVLNRTHSVQSTFRCRRVSSTKPSSDAVPAFSE